MAQEREFYKYCQLPQRPGLLDRPPVSPRTEANVELLPQSSQDTTLTALAQLGALRLNVQRCMISLFDRRTQYILTEATRTLSLQDDRVHLDGDALWLGSSVIRKEDGICHFCCQDSVLNARQCETDAPCAFVVPDLTKDDRFNQRQYVVKAPHLRFFAGVPIRSRRGIAIGAFSVSDGKTRPGGLSPLEVRFMADTAAAIMNHLEMVRSHEQNRRGANMIAGLGNFVEGGIFPSSSIRRKSRLNVEVDNEEAEDKEEPLRNSALLSRHSQPRSELAVKDRITREKSPAPSESKELTPPYAPSTPKRKRENEVTLTSGTREIFGRAARILQQSLDVQGVAFYDASVKSYAGLVRNTDDRPSDGESSSGSSEAPEASASDSDNPATGHSTTDTDDFSTSDVLGYSLEDPEQPMGAMRETFLRSLLRNYPQGAIFNVDENGSISSSEGSDSSSGTSVSREIMYRRHEAPKVQRRWKQQKRHRLTLKEENKWLLKIFPSARCITLFPLWDSRRNRWFSGLFLWTKSPRSFSLGGELAYLYAFSNSIMAEIHRLDIELANRAHATLVGSISHELRSPLHGILGSTELLTDSDLTPAQTALVNTVEHCGRSLLDIINNMLDFAKINQFARKSRSSRFKLSPPQRRLQRSLKPGKTNGVVNLISDVQLDAVLEEVAESVFAGHCFSSKNRTLAQASMPTLDQEGELIMASPTERPLSAFNESLTIIYDVAPDILWLFETQAGAWRRVLMNLFGNALKYTQSGYILVSLKSSTPAPTKGRRLSRDENVDMASVTLSVKDTGQGIDKEYLQSNVFKPFSQENPLSPGSGLGLSIVHQTVISLGGKIDISSTKGAGTEVKVRVDLPRTPNSEDTNNDQNQNHRAVAETRDLVRGKTIGLVGFGTPSEHNEEALTILRSALSRMYQDHFDMKVGVASPEEPGSFDIYVVRQTYLDTADEICRKVGAVKGKRPAVLVICSTPQIAQKLSSTSSERLSPAIYEFISQPCGPYKTANALRACVDRQENQRPSLPLTNGATKANGYANSDGATNGITNGVTNSVTNGITNGVTNAKEPPNGLTELKIETLKSAFPVALSPKSLAKQNGAVTTDVDVQVSPTSTVTTITTSAVDEGDGAVTEISATLEASRIVPSVLLVDDNSVNLQLLVAVMKKAKLPYFTACNGLEALEVYKAHAKEIHVILMDISMPVMDGLESTREIRLFEKTQRDSPSFKPATIIALSGLGSASVRQEAFNSGLDLFLSKPVRFQELIKQLGELMR
ncbi:putative sensor histidine kinase/response regulator [Aspergillus mulundensis]|uniref:Uncharacterized protein n=1 Tax=Aspergillus mulundensis TaxID=1810919 RepID=A0A3D8R0Y1_9EURO|nr:hypothetical protein DSM5745_09360 [Aspergillus mulundensis]RDW67494.1 hypothetical protein DSM5745_09360 [Aspergillus mulundensis]